MNDSKRQTFVMIGIVLLVVAGILIYAGLSQPRVYENTASVPSAAASSDTSADNEKSVTVATDYYSSVSYPVNLNTATYDELVSIDGIGNARANQILQYRDAIGGYSSVEQIKNISGIGESVYSQIAPYLTV